MTHPYDTLTPDTVINAIESTGMVCDMRLTPLNSYENRVYQVGIEDCDPIIAKFYRPDRWSNSSIQEEHDFLIKLSQHDIPVIAPIVIEHQSIFQYQGFRFALFQRRNGHAPEFSNFDHLEQLGRWLARMHKIGHSQPFTYRPILHEQNSIKQSAQTVLNSNIIPSDFIEAYRSTCEDLNTLVNQQYQPNTNDLLNIHGDFHVGNILLRDDDFYFVDFDDCMQGPAIQDIWMLLSGQREEQLQQLNAIHSGYDVFHPFPYHQLKWVESLRTLRIVKYSAWLATRWSDPAFKMAFPWFTSVQYWSEHIIALREQIFALQEAPLIIYS
jgi:Ser/Thr protein kinase RdoA (MazF antagonist)